MAEKQQLSGASGFKVRVVTPRGTAADTEADAVTGPGRLGEFKLLPGHLPFLTELHPGVLVLGDESRECFAVGTGYLQVGDGAQVEVLVERVVAGGEVDIEAANAELKEVVPLVNGWKGALDAEFQKLQLRRDWAQAQLDAHRLSGS